MIKEARIYNTEKTASSLSGAGRTGQLKEYLQKKNIHKKISKWVKALNVRPDTIEFSEGNMGRTLFDIYHSKIFFDPSPRVMKIKTKIQKWDLMKLKSFCTAKETINQMKRQPSEWKRIFPIKATDKGVISKIYKQLMQLNIHKQNETKQHNQ